MEVTIPLTTKVKFTLCSDCLSTEHAEVGCTDAEADQPRETSRTVEEQSRAGDPELQGRGSEAAQDHLPAGEGARPIYQ